MISENPKNLVAMLVYVVALGATATASATHLEDVQTDLDTHRQAWQSLDFDDYTYRLQRICFCIDPYTAPGIVHVSNGEITSVVHAITGVSLDPEIFLTVDALFAEIQKGVDAHAETIAAEYDPTFGYPTKLDIDFIAQVVDEEISYRAGELVAIPEPICSFLQLWVFVAMAFRKARRPAIS